MSGLQRQGWPGTGWTLAGLHGGLADNWLTLKGAGSGLADFTGRTFADDINREVFQVS